MSAPSSFGSLTVFDGITSTDGRLAVSVGIIVAAVVFSQLALPGLVSLGRRLVAATIVRGPVRNRVDRLAKWAPWWATERLLVQFFQAVLTVGTAIGVLLVWGQYDLVLGAVTALSLSVPVLGQIGITILLFILAWIAVDFLDSWLDHVTERSEQFSKHQEEIAFRVIQIVLFTGVSLGALTMWGIDLGGLLVGAGFLGIVVGIAAQQTLGSLLAGFVLMFSRPFEIGDWVQIGEEEGIVTDITIVNTRMENFDGEMVVLPNDTVSNSTLINRSMKGRLRLRVEVGIDYDADPEHAQDVAVDALSDVNQLLSVPRPVAVTSRLGDSAVVLELRFWIDKPSARRRAKATSAAVRAVKSAFEAENIKIPYPQRELTGRREAGGFRVIDKSSGADDR
ncbi:Small-conductance mechanosensitive channel [Halanaeroarchaeum sp. HSR-CO]|uniref:mechanosensitive ion channel family protein n=1 Tax=Halanaeroarchaeum sp. HSR-CO TaxID=2866382 RepID=UPI00217E3A25|nr:mechanosensitive ion channel family protein [Halanaeroarchaeum sp. HSR-CO]UWG47649.1 Small-conductance mechanosensitive channel [Halanaeroarchaeum sp. HSR-CO]